MSLSTSFVCLSHSFVAPPFTLNPVLPLRDHLQRSCMCGRILRPSVTAHSLCPPSSCIYSLLLSSNLFPSLSEIEMMGELNGVKVLKYHYRLCIFTVLLSSLSLSLYFFSLLYLKFFTLTSRINKIK